MGRKAFQSRANLTAPPSPLRFSPLFPLISIFGKRNAIVAYHRCTPLLEPSMALLACLHSDATDFSRVVSELIRDIRLCVVVRSRAHGTPFRPICPSLPLSPGRSLA
jgi:hypothetical protein